MINRLKQRFGGLYPRKTEWNGPCQNLPRHSLRGQQLKHRRLCKSDRVSQETYVNSNKEADIRDFPRRVEDPEQLKRTQLFFNRELSLLQFHARF